MSETAAPPALLRLSQLARFWELHPRTIRGWIQQGRLPAIRSPGNHLRLRPADVRAFCEREGLAVPPFVSPPARRVVVASSPAVRRALSRALKGAAAIEGLSDPYDALVRAAGGSVAVLAVDAATPRFDAARAVRALKRGPAAADTIVIAFRVEGRAQAAALARAGARTALTPEETADLPRVVREALGLELLEP